MAHAGLHDPALVGLSVAIAMLAAFVALDLADRMKAAAGWARRAWLMAAALVLGGGVWSMHFVAMLAFRLPGIEITYDLGLTLLSLAVPVAVTALGLSIAKGPGSEGGDGTRPRTARIALAGLVTGLGIVSMHYTGMAAMHLPGALRYDPAWVAASVVVAVVAATAAIRLALAESGVGLRIAAAGVMGLAIAGMHFSGMQGLTVAHHAAALPDTAAAGFGQARLAVGVTAVTVLVLVLALSAAAIDRRFSQNAAREAAALRASEERYRLLLESVTDYAIFMLDRDGMVANWNAGARRIKGYEAEEIVGTHFSCFYTEEERAQGVPARALATALAAGKFEAEGWRLRRDGTRFWASVVIDPIRDGDGVHVGFAKVTRDITERRRAQEALAQAQGALAQAQKMEAVGQLTGGVAHDFNNLLMAVLGSLELMRKRLPDDPRLLRLLDNAVQGAERGAALTQRMLAFARRQELRPEPVDLARLVRGMADLLQRSIGPEIRIETRFPLRLPPALVDAHQLELALLNLVVNARDAMPGGGTVTIAARAGEDEGAEREGAGPDEAGTMLCLSVADTGTGMDEAVLARAQEPFFTTKGVGKGTGLGLSMVHGLAAQSHGRLALRSRPGSGTTAEIWLPVAAQAVAEPSPRSVAGPRVPPSQTLLTSQVVLVVDDDPLVLENSAAMLEDLGHRVIEARSGREALALMRRARTLDLVLTDHAMPEMTGVELAARILAERPGLKVILATGYADLGSGEGAQLPRLAKPYDQAALARMIETVMRGAEPGDDTVVPFPRSA
ncbi:MULTISPECIES: MHYT domain-containing protein [Methylobacterium]|jgi:PAS domain S-box-containing protein|uniref:MHYT domain-containing protein n=1 Tax=Methylobacterium TaxID=407 RepID=UPI0008E453F7|nr:MULTISPECIES: MHYT domain-containing protein [Methylobacterium]MBZ6415844.1 PAS domain S-box protein [Methylobacterium sp.]MBK3395185.1 PAS domain S-box protein [Methylobacterium ajmalii]MBK3411208.1 PAS domain S-box protein [Methylobacterium ajmalii]MBK3426295.1 PAS domain S-box protein [Methylobacterium ajmalii]SFF39747.1 PAS domain S-box-containing protein [Methylobacterium sp. yr596]